MRLIDEDALQAEYMRLRRNAMRRKAMLELELSDEEKRLIRQLRSYHNGSYATVIDKLIAYAKSMQWIPCSERLPEKDQICIVTDDTQKCAYEYGFHNDTYDEVNGWTYLRHKIIAWMPMPEPWRGNADETD